MRPERRLPAKEDDFQLRVNAPVHIAAADTASTPGWSDVVLVRLDGEIPRELGMAVDG